MPAFAQSDGVDLCFRSAGVDPDLCNHDKRTPVHVAAATGSVLIIELLRDFGANLSARDRWNKTPLKEAINEGHQRVVEILLASGNMAVPKVTARCLMPGGHLFYTLCRPTCPADVYPPLVARSSWGGIQPPLPPPAADVSSWGHHSLRGVMD